MVLPHRIALAVVVLCTSWGDVAPVLAQSAAPKLSKAQRTLLEAVVSAVDSAATGAAGVIQTEATWTSHVLRASDGSHYVALRADVPTLPASRDAVTMYVRLTPRAPAGETVVSAPRSAVMDWLKGLRGDPLPMRAARSTTVSVGEMPVGGAAASVGDITAGATAALRLVELQRERQERFKEDEAARRRSELEHAPALRPALLPFEDFDPAVQTAIGPGGALRILRGVTAGPGTFDVHLGWASPPARNELPRVHVISHRLALPSAPLEFGLSDIIVAEDVRPLTQPYTSLQQASHPYAFGGIEVTPAAGNRLVTNGTLGVMYQVVHPSGTATGKPDVDVNFQLFRVHADRLEPYGRLEAQHHDGASVPDDFNVGLGHPLFGAVRAPLANFPRGRYRLDVVALDRLSGRRATAETLLEVKGSPEHLLREAPAAGQAFRREQLLSAEILAQLADALRPAMPSAELERALGAVAAGKFAEVVQAGIQVPAERPIAHALLGLALYGLGDSPRTVIAQLTQARAQGAPTGAVHFILGAAAALSRDDVAAIAAWNEARVGRLSDAMVAPFLVDAYLRQGDITRAEAMARAMLDAQPNDRSARRALASAYIASRRFAAALAVIDVEGTGASEADTFLGLHAIFAAHVAGTPVDGGRQRFTSLTRSYIENRGRYLDLVKEWLAVVEADGR